MLQQQKPKLGITPVEEQEYEAVTDTDSSKLDS